jgi:hypothetical protein
MTVTVAPERQRAASTTKRRLMVNWQDPKTHRYHQVGWLSHTPRGYEFRYLPNAKELDGFHPFLGFPSVQQTYRSPHLFPLFSERLLAPDRPDLPQILKLLALNSDEPLEFLARSGGRRHGDTIELMAEPETGFDGTARCVFLVHGVRHLKDAGDLINHLSTGDRLGLRPDQGNPVNPRALLVTNDGRPLGWVPDPILDFVHQLHGPSVTVVRANPPTFGHHLRLLVEIEGRT